MALFQKVRIVFHISQKIFQISILNYPEFEICARRKTQLLLTDSKNVEFSFLSPPRVAKSALHVRAKIQKTNANKLKIEKRNIFIK